MEKRFTPHNLEGDVMPPIRPHIPYEKSEQLYENESERVQLVREVLRSIDEDLLHDIFLEYVLKSGNDGETMRFIPIQHVRVIHNKDVKNSGSCSENQITLNTYYINGPAEVLWTLIHEQLHAITYTPILENEDGQNRRVGYSTSSKVELEGEQIDVTMFDEINEGVTEWLTEQIFEVYLMRSGGLKDSDTLMNARLKYQAYREDSKLEKQYATYYRTTIFFINLLSVLSDTPSQTVAGALIRGYFRNSNIIFEELTNRLGNNRKVLEGFFDLLHNESPGFEKYEECLTLLIQYEILSKDTSIDEIMRPLHTVDQKETELLDRYAKAVEITSEKF